MSVKAVSSFSIRYKTYQDMDTVNLKLLIIGDSGTGKSRYGIKRKSNRSRSSSHCVRVQLVAEVHE